MEFENGLAAWLTCGELFLVVGCAIPFCVFRVKLSILNDIWSSLTIQQHAVRKQIKFFFVCQSARGFGLNGQNIPVHPAEKSRQKTYQLNFCFTI